MCNSGSRTDSAAPDGGAERLDVDWARRFADEKVTASWVDVLWNGALVDRELVYNADGGRVILPASQVMYHTESPSDRTEIIGEYVTQWEYHLARIVAGFEGQRDFEGDFERAGFTLLDHYVNGLGPGL
jgi:hypothetical protein